MPEIKGEKNNKGLNQHRFGSEEQWRGGIKQFGALLINVHAQTQAAIAFQMEQNRGEQMNPRLITPLWAVKE